MPQEGQHAELVSGTDRTNISIRRTLFSCWELFLGCARLGGRLLRKAKLCGHTNPHHPNLASSVTAERPPAVSTGHSAPTDRNAR